MGLTNDIATALAAKLAGVIGMYGASATGADAIPDVPYAILGPAHGAIEAGNFETETLDFPLTVLVAAMTGESDTLVATYDMKDLVQAALRSGVTLGLGTSGVRSALLTAWNADVVVKDIAGQTYGAFDGTIVVTLGRGGTYTP